MQFKNNTKKSLHLNLEIKFKPIWTQGARSPASKRLVHLVSYLTNFS